MMKYFNLLLFCLYGAFAFWSTGCGGGDDTADSDQGDDTNSGGEDTQPGTCDLSVMETFDSAIPAGWTVLAGGSGTGSASGSGNGGAAVDPNKTWHYSTDSWYQDEAKGRTMDGGYMFVGGTMGMNEELLTSYYTIGACSSVNLGFRQYFDDWDTNPNDRGEVWFMGDAPPWSLLKTYNSNPDKTTTTEKINLPTAGQSSFQLKFVFTDDNGSNYGWAIDDVSITDAE
jgi:hypothetical protein